MSSPLSSPRRSASRAPFRCQCLERSGPAHHLDEAFPVKLVVFDFDETLTLITYLIEDGDSEEVQRQIVKTNFQTPWVKGSRIEHLKSMLKALSTSNAGHRRALVVLTKNSAGEKAVHLLLHVSGLARYFDAIWALPSGGLYRLKDEWFEIPTPTVCHKADLLALVVESTSDFLPQLNYDAEWKDFGDLKMEGIVLVDDQRANFQSPSGAQVLRFCKVARYDGYYRNLGYVKNMGGIGAHCFEDYETLKIFVEAPSTYKETLCLHCVERHFDNSSSHPIDLIIFDFDETLTLATFMPSDRHFDDLDWNAGELDGTDWSIEDLLTYNFESPFYSGSRLDSLRVMLRALSKSCTLVILSSNDRGAVAVLNLLKLAELDIFFEAIWTTPLRQQVPCGAFRSSTWETFEPPLMEVVDEKTEILHHIVAHPQKWFPQMSEGQLPQLASLRTENVMLVDDERQNLQNASRTALRYCKVARYDDVYRSCGPLNQLGGIGAHSCEDFEVLPRFASSPWQFQEPHFPQEESSSTANPPWNESRVGSRCEELAKLPRRRETFHRSVSSPSLRPQPMSPPMSRSQSFCLSDGMSPRANGEGLDPACETEMYLIGMDE